MAKLEALTQVYSYMYPEVRRVVFNTIFPSLVQQISTNPNSTKLISEIKTDGDLIPLLEKAFREDYLAQFLRTPQEMDAMHIPIIQKYIDLHRESLPGLENFQWRYPIAGSEEGIREIMTFLLSKGFEQVYVLKGEYEGYKETGKTRGHQSHSSIGQIKTFEIDPNRIDITKLSPGWFFISNPSARDGNIIPNDFIRKICEAGHMVFYDLAYVDSTGPHVFDLSHENIRYAVCSFSKPYGLFYFRAGFAFSKEEIPSLYANKWFKVAPSLVAADKLMDEIDPKQLFQRYRPFQKKIVNQINSELGLGLRVSDALLLAHLTQEDERGLDRNQLSLVAPFKRGNGYRFCLKPYYEMLERQGVF